MKTNLADDLAWIPSASWRTGQIIEGLGAIVAGTIDAVGFNYSTKN